LTTKPQPVPLAPKKPTNLGTIIPNNHIPLTKNIKPAFIFEPPGSKHPENILEKLSESPALGAIDLSQGSPLLGLNANA
jgi:hypothetical protein